MTLDEKEIKELKAYLNDEADCPDFVIDYAQEHWAGEIPYGVLTGDTGTIDEWLCDRIEWVRDAFSEYLE